MSFDLILPFLRPIAHLIQDPDVTEIMVNGSQRVFVERDGVVQRGRRTCGSTSATCRVAVKNIARALGDDVSEEKPILDSRLPDGSRVAAVFPPCSLGGTTLTIRKFQTRFFTAEELVRIGTMTPEVLVDSCATAIAEPREHPDQRRHGHRQDDAPERARGVSPGDDRVVLIEDTAELQIDAPEPRAVRGAARAGRPAGGHDSRLAARDAAPSPGPDHRRRSARRGSVRPAAGAEHRPLR